MAQTWIALTAKEFALTETQGRAVDSELLEGYREGSLPSFERLYEEHGARMKSIASNLLGDLADAEGAVQETFLKVYGGLSLFRRGASFSTWIYRILVNTCYDLMRKNRRRAEGPLPARPLFAAGEADHPLRLSIETAVRRLEPQERRSIGGGAPASGRPLTAAGGYQRWYAGCPGLTATKVPRQVAVILPLASRVASTTARSSFASTTRAFSCSGVSMGVGRLSTTWKSAVTVQGGVEPPDCFIR